MASKLGYVVLLAFLATAVFAHDSSSSEEEGEEEHSGPETLPFMVRMYEGSFEPAGECDECGARATLTIHYVGLAPFEVTWAIDSNDVGTNFGAMSGARTWSRCVECQHGGYICSSSIQTNIIPALRRLNAELIYASNNTVIRYHGFNSQVKNFRGANETIHRTYLAAPLVVYSHPPRKNRFTPGDDVTLHWEMASDNIHELVWIKRKVGAQFATEELFNHEEDDDHSGETTVTVSNVVTKITITKTTGNMYNYAVELTISGATSDDAGVYVVGMHEGMENWVEVMPELTASAYPEYPNLHMNKRVFRTHFGIICTAEGQTLTDINLYHNNELLESTTTERIERTSRTEDALAIVYMAEPTEEKTWEEYSGDYQCIAGQANGNQAAIHEEYVFEHPAAEED